MMSKLNLLVLLAVVWVGLTVNVEASVNGGFEVVDNPYNLDCTTYIDGLAAYLTQSGDTLQTASEAGFVEESHDSDRVWPGTDWPAKLVDGVADVDYNMGDQIRFMSDGFIDFKFTSGYTGGRTFDEMAFNVGFHETTNPFHVRILYSTTTDPNTFHTLVEVRNTDPYPRWRHSRTTIQTTPLSLPIDDIDTIRLLHIRFIGLVGGVFSDTDYEELDFYMVDAAGPAAACVLEWKLDETSGLAAADTSGNSNNGTVSGTPAWVPGLVGNCLEFNNDDDKVIALSTTALPVQGSQSWSINLYANFDVAPDDYGVVGGFGDVIGGPSDAVRYIYDWAYWGASFWSYIGGTCDLLSGVAWDVNKWQMITATYDGTTLRLYKDAGLIGSQDCTFEDAAQQANLASWGFRGEIDEFTIWDGTLTQLELFALADILPDEPAAVKVVEWKLEERYQFSGDPEYYAEDTSGNGNHGLLAGIPDANVVSGLVGNCMRFGGSSSVKKDGGVNLPVGKWDSWSINVYVYTDTLPADTENGTFMTIAGLGNAGQGVLDTARFIYDFGNEIACWGGTDLIGVSSANIGTGRPWSFGEWQMVTITYDHSVIRIYKNGREIGSKSAIFEDAVASVQLDPYGQFEGLLDEFTVWDGALIQAEISGLAEVLPFVSDDSAPAQKVLEWKLDETAGSVASDTSGNGNNGTLVNGPSWVAGLAGNCLEFYGGTGVGQAREDTNDYVEMVSAINLPTSGWAAWSINVYVYLDEMLYSGLYEQTKGVAGFGDAFKPNDYFGSNDGDTTNSVRYVFYEPWDRIHYFAFGSDLTTAVPFTIGGWQMLTVTSDNEGLVSIYKNAELVGTVAATAVSQNADPVAALAPMNTFAGRLDEFTIWEGTLTQAEIDNLALLLPIPGDIDGDQDVDLDDLKLLAAGWLTDTFLPLESDMDVDDFESYTSTGPGTGTLLNSWTEFPEAPGQSMMTLLTQPADAQSGDQAMRWEYNVAAGQWAEVVWVAGSPVNLSLYDEMRFWVKRHAGNSEADLFYVKFLEGTSTGEIAAEHWWTQAEGSTYADPNEWVELVVDLNDLLYGGTAALGYTELSEITAVEQIMIGCVQSVAGTGTIDVDDIILHDLPGCTVVADEDINGDCRVDLLDFSILAENWLKGVQ